MWLAKPRVSCRATKFSVARWSGRMLRRHVRLHRKSEAHYFPAVAGAHERENVDATVGEFSVAMEIIRRPHGRNPLVHENRRIPNSFQGTLCPGGQPVREFTQQPVAHSRAFCV